MLTRRVALLQQCSCLKNIYSRKATKTKLDSSELAFPSKIKLPVPKPKSEKREPFAKGFFIGRFDNEILTYPEPQTDERHREFLEWLKPVEEYMKTVDAKRVYESSSFSPEMRAKLQELGVYGGRISYDYDGLNLLDSEYLKLIETLSIVPKVGQNFIQCNNFPVEFLKKYGTVEQRHQYLRKIASGEYIPAILANESERRVDPENVRTEATLSIDESTWSLNGEKTFVQQDNNANIFIVYALGRVGGDRRRIPETLSSFIVDRNTPGVGECIQVKSPWLGKENMFSVKFKDVVIPYGNLIGEVGDGLNSLEDYLTSELVYSAGVYISIMRNYLNALIQHVINNGSYGRECVKKIISKTSNSLYAMESIAYLTTSMSDLYDEQDLVMEEAVVKEFCSRECIARVQEGFRLLDTHLCQGTFPLEEVIRNQMFGAQGNADLSTYLGLQGLKYSGTYLADLVKKSRNPFDNPHFNIKRFFGFEETFQRRYLEEHLHPSYQHHVQYLEQSFGRMEKSVKTFLVRHGANAMVHEMDVQRLSEMVTLIYAMTAVFGRASRSYCIGLRNAEHELGVASTFAYQSHLRIELLSKEIEHGDYVNGNQYNTDMCQLIYDSKKYCFEHPLERNW